MKITHHFFTYNFPFFQSYIHTCVYSNFKDIKTNRMYVYKKHVQYVQTDQLLQHWFNTAPIPLIPFLLQNSHHILIEFLKRLAEDRVLILL